MSWRYNSIGKLRELEHKDLRKQESEQLRERASMNPSRTTKQSIIMILKGIFFAITLTAIEYALKKPEISGYLRTVLQIGFFGSLLGIFYVPYGLHHLILGFRQK